MLTLLATATWPLSHLLSSLGPSVSYKGTNQLPEHFHPEEYTLNQVVMPDHYQTSNLHLLDDHCCQKVAHTL